MSDRASNPTQNLLLEASEVLRNTLLPRLDAVSLYRLGSTCKAMQEWVLSTPPQLWQVRTTAIRQASPASSPLSIKDLGVRVQESPKDTAAAHLASLATTEQV